MIQPSVIEKLKIKAKESLINDDIFETIFVGGYDYKWLLTSPVTEYKRFGKVLADLNFKFIYKQGGNEKETSYCESVIELEGQLYKLQYSHYPYNSKSEPEGYCFYDKWDWKPVIAKQKTVTYYE